LKVTTIFEWYGEPPRCEAVQINAAGTRGIIRGQTVFQEAITDPVKGHLWDLKNDKCLVHQNCDCKLLIHVFIYDLELFSISEGTENIAKRLEAVRMIEQDITASRFDYEGKP